MEKPRDRAERRWRSFTKWMRRLRSDWNDHGWRRDPVPKYDWRDGRLCLIGWSDSLCGCFDLKDMQALRFKDTPNGCNCRGCDNPRHVYDGKMKESLTLHERRAFLDDREDWRKRKRREGSRIVSVSCMRCGRSIGRVRLKYGKRLYEKLKEMGWDRRCTSCRKRMVEEKKAK